jgi:hypothetical protein
VETIARKDVKRKCPKCGNGYMTPIHTAKNFEEVFDRKLKPKYYFCFKCNHKEFVGGVSKDSTFKPWKP